MSGFASTNAAPVVNAEESAPNRELAHPQRGVREREILQVFQNLDCKRNMK
jgi:FKBP12-rapamycin complex-associated protein